MQAAVSVFFGVLNIIRAAQNHDVVLRAKHVCDPVNIVDIIAHHAHARNIRQICLGILNAHGRPFPPELFHNACDALKPAVDMVNWVMIVTHAELRVQNFQLCRDFTYGAFVKLRHFHIILRLPDSQLHPGGVQIVRFLQQAIQFLHGVFSF